MDQMIQYSIIAPTSIFTLYRMINQHTEEDAEHITASVSLITEKSVHNWQPGNGW